jgi:hypothetical protein
MNFDPKQLSLFGNESVLPAKPQSKITEPTKMISGPFLKGPISLDWLTRAARLPGRTLEVAIAIRYLSGMQKSPTVKLSNKLMREFGVSRYAKQRAIKAMQDASLIRVSQTRGRSPIVTIVEIQTDET